MTNPQDWREALVGALGVADLELGQHPSDERRAIDAMRAARRSGATLDELQDAVVAHLVSAGATQEHLHRVVRQLLALVWEQTSQG